MRNEAKQPITKATEFLVSALANGPMPTNELEKMATSIGVSIKTLKRARKLIGVQAYKKWDAWECRLNLESTDPLGGPLEVGPLEIVGPHESDPVETLKDEGGPIEAIQENQGGHQEGQSNLEQLIKRVKEVILREIPQEKIEQFKIAVRQLNREALSFQSYKKSKLSPRARNIGEYDLIAASVFSYTDLLEDFGLRVIGDFDGEDFDSAGIFLSDCLFDSDLDLETITSGLCDLFIGIVEGSLEPILDHNEILAFLQKRAGGPVESVEEGQASMPTVPEGWEIALEAINEYVSVANSEGFWKDTLEPSHFLENLANSGMTPARACTAVARLTSVVKNREAEGDNPSNFGAVLGFVIRWGASVPIGVNFA